MNGGGRGLAAVAVRVINAGVRVVRVRDRLRKLVHSVLEAVDLGMGKTWDVRMKVINYFLVQYVNVSCDINSSLIKRCAFFS